MLMLWLKQLLTRLLLIWVRFREEVDWVSAGNLASLTLTGEVKAGETLVDVEHKAEHGSF